MDIKPDKIEIKEISIQNKLYTIKEKISSGGFGTVYKACFNNEDYAIKEIKLDDNAKLKALIAELCFVHKLTTDDENENFPIIKIFDYEWLENKKSLFYVMELGNQSLHQYFLQLRGFNDFQRINAFWIIYSFILKALLYFESINTAHRDIKPQNFIIIDDSSYEWGFNIKLIDFGTVRILGTNQQTFTPYVGTFPYMAPEVINDVTCIKSDIWSLGIILFELINNGKLPEHVKTLQKTLSFAKSNDSVIFPKCSALFAPFQDIAKKCLVKKHNERMNASQLYQYTKQKYKVDTLDKIISKSSIENTIVNNQLIKPEEKKESKIEGIYNCVQTVNGHKSWVGCLQLIDEHTLASGSDDTTIKIWDLRNYSCIETLSGHTLWIWCLQLINKNTLASGSGDSTIKIWDLINKTCIQTLYAHTEGVWCFQVINDLTLASVSHDTTIKIWDLRNNSCVQTLSGHTSWVRSLQVINEHTLVSGSYDNTIKIWDLRNNSCVQTLIGHTSWVRHLRLINEHTLVSGSFDSTIKIWDLRNNSCVQTLTGHASAILCIQVINEHSIVSCSDDTTIKIWDLRNNSCVQTLSEHSLWVWYIQVINEHSIVSCSGDCTIKFWNKKD